QRPAKPFTPVRFRSSPSRRLRALSHGGSPGTRGRAPSLRVRRATVVPGTCRPSWRHRLAPAAPARCGDGVLGDVVAVGVAEEVWVDVGGDPGSAPYVLDESPDGVRR